METSNGMNKTRMLIIGAILFVFVLGIAQFFLPHSVVSPTLPAATTTAERSNAITTTATVNVQKPSIAHPLPLVTGDTIASWDFTGAYSGNPDLEIKAQNEIKRISGLMGEGSFSDLSLYVGIANQYELLGNGKKQYEYLGRAIGAGGTVSSGLPWHNLGVLMERLGALKTARVAYEKATLVDPKLKFYHAAYFEFLTTRMRDDIADIEKEFAAAIANLGQDADILRLRSEWEQS